LARNLQPSSELYGEYPGLTENQIKFVKIASDPRNKLRNLKDEDLALELGLNKKSLYYYRQNPKVREAIAKETMLKSADSLPDVMTQLFSMIKSKNIPESSRVQAMKLYFQVMGLLEEAKQKHAETRRDIKRTGEQKLKELAKKFRGTLVQPPE